MFEYYGHTHVYSPGAGHPLGPKHFHKHEYSVHLLIPSKFFAITGIGPQTIVYAFYESLHVAEQFATNFMKINQGIRKV